MNLNLQMGNGRGNTISRTDLLFYAKAPGMTDFIGELTYLIDRSGNDNHLTFFGYCPTFDGSAGQYISGSQILGNETIADFGGTAETLTIAAGKITPSAGTVEWFQFTDGRKYILQSSKTALQTKFWSINGHIGDTVTLVGLTAPYCTSKSSTPSLLNGYSHEESRIGVAAQGQSSEPLSLTEIGTNGGITARAGSGNLSAYRGELVYGDNSVFRYGQFEGINNSDILYLDVDVAMDDGGAPIPGASNDATADFAFYIKGNSVPTGATVTAVGNGVYRVRNSRSGIGSSTKCGIYKYTTNSARGFRITRFHLHVNPDAAYVATKYTANIALYNSGIVESFLPHSRRHLATTKIVCIGDSLTEGNYPVNLQAILQKATVVDKGVAGNTVAAMKARFVADVLGQSPDYICYFGIVNSAIADVSAAAIIADIDWMITQAGSIPMIIGTGTPWGTNTYWTAPRQAVIDAVNAHILAHTASNVIAKLDLFTPLLAAGSQVNLVASAEATPGEGLHLNAAGDTVITRLFYAGLNMAGTVLSAKNILGIDLAPGLIALNAPAALEPTDVDNRWFAADHSANDVDPTTIPANAGDKIFKGPSALLMYSTALTGANITKAENYVD